MDKGLALGLMMGLGVLAAPLPALADECAPDDEACDPTDEISPEEEEAEPEDERRVREFRTFGTAMLFQGGFSTGLEDPNLQASAGFGILMRAQPMPWLALDGGFTGAAGADDLGRSQSDIAFSLDTVWFPTEGWVRPYLVVGAEVTNRTTAWNDLNGVERSLSFQYVGPRSGVGLEIAPMDRITFFLDAVFTGRFPTSDVGNSETIANVAVRSGAFFWW
jgi:hypothetical protein